MTGGILVVGSLNLDLVAQVQQMAHRGETVLAQRFASALGGKGANQAVACARLGAQVHMIGRVGDDVFGEQLRRAVAEAGVDVRCVETVEGPSGLAMITVDAEGQNAITVVGGANQQMTPAALQPYRSRIEEAALVLTQLEVPMETVSLLATITTAAKVPLMLDPAPAQTMSQELLEQVTWLTPNQSEARALLGGTRFGRLEQVAEHLLAKGCRNVVLKLGAAGAYIAGADMEAGCIDSYPVDAVDSTAAGDSFNGAFAVALVEGLSPTEAARFACAAAALSVTRHGAASSMPRRAEVQDLLRAQAGAADLAHRRS